MSLASGHGSGSATPASGMRGTDSGRESRRGRAVSRPEDALQAAAFAWHNQGVQRARDEYAAHPFLDADDLPPIKHGAESGYRVHYARGTTPCQACRQAHQTYRRAA